MRACGREAASFSPVLHACVGSVARRWLLVALRAAAARAVANKAQLTRVARRQPIRWRSRKAACPRR